MPKLAFTILMFFFSQLLPSADFLPPSHSPSSCYTNHAPVLHYIHEFSMWSFSCLVTPVQYIHYLASVRPSQSGLSNFIPKRFNLICTFILFTSEQISLLVSIPTWGLIPRQSDHFSLWFYGEALVIPALHSCTALPLFSYVLHHPHILFCHS